MFGLYLLWPGLALWEQSVDGTQSVCWMGNHLCAGFSITQDKTNSTVFHLGRGSLGFGVLMLQIMIMKFCLLGKTLKEIKERKRR